MKTFPSLFATRRKQPFPLRALVLCTLGLALATVSGRDPSDYASISREIDALVLKKLEQQKINPNSPASEDVFLRRVYLDTVGRIPTIKETRDFLGSKDPNKRPKLIDTLLDSDGYVQHHFNFWADVLRLKTNSMGGAQSLAAGLAYADWVKKSLAENKPYDQFVRELITAEGKTYENGAVGFYLRDYNMQLDNMAVTTQVFLGTQMVCAQCHDHPFDKWSMMDYYQMAAHTFGIQGTNNLPDRSLFDAAYSKKGAKGKNAAPGMDKEQRLELNKAMTEILRPLRYNNVVHRDRSLRLPHDYEYDDAKPLAIVKPAIPASFSKTETSTVEGQSPVVSYAEWMTSPENPRFTLVIANRLWKKVMGQGVIEPVDELTDSSVPSNPALMAFLEGLMKDVNYDLKAYLRVLMNTETYQRSAHTQELALGEVYHFPGPLMRRMTAEQIWDSYVALYKSQPDKPSKETELERDNQLTRVRWLDQALNALSDEELLLGARRIAELQKTLSADVRQAQEDLVKAQEAKDEEGIRAARQVVAMQRATINKATQDIVYEMGYQKFVDLAKSGKLKEQADPDLAREIGQVLASDKGRELHFDEALAAVQKLRRDRLNQIAEAQRGRMKESLSVTKENAGDFTRYARNIERTVLRAADLRTPAPNGHFLREFGQSDRELIENANREATVGQALTLLNGSHFEDLLNPFTVLSRALARAESADQTVDTLYLALLSRTATSEEKQLLGPIISGADTEGKAEALWTLLNTKQFLFIQ